MKSTIKISLLLVVIISGFNLASCKKQPGTGGVAQITGNVYADTIFDNKNNLYLGSGFIASTTVYLCYDKDTVASQSTKTSYNGAYKFDFLQKGNYTVYVLSDNKPNTNGHFNPFSYVKKSVTISKRKEVVNVETMHINYAY
ncbi:MAG: hypothetical protein RL065_634 [Bacteroidota bacterium]|jgi:hypothetical protein